MDIRQVMAGRVNPLDHQSLINPAKTDRTDFNEKPKGYYQSLVLGAVGVICAFLTGYTYERYLAVDLTPLAMIVALFLFVSFSALQVFVVKKISYRVGFIVAETVALFLPFVAFHGWIFFLAFVVAFLFLLWGYVESRSELNYGTEIRFFKVTHAVTAKLVTITLLFAILFFVVVRGGGSSFFMGQGSFTSFFENGSTFFTDFYPGILVGGSFQDFAESVARQQLTNNSQYKALTSGEQVTAIQDAGSTLSANFSRALGVPIDSTSTVSGVVYDFIVTSLQHWHDRFGSWFVFGWAFVVFLILRSFGVIFTVVVQFFAMIVYEVLLATGVIRVVEHPQTKEVVEFS